MADEKDEQGWLVTLVIGLILTPLGGWLALNGSGVCLAIRLTDFCLIGGQTFGVLAFLFGLLLLWGGYDDFKQGKSAI